MSTRAAKNVCKASGCDLVLRISEKRVFDSHTRHPPQINGQWGRVPSGSRLSFCEQKPLLRSDPIALCVGIVAVVAAFDATTPTHTRFGIDILSAVQPVVVSRALHGVNTRLLN